MAIEFHCPLCGAAIRVPDHASGKKGTCPACHAKLLVPQVEPPPSDQKAAPHHAARTPSVPVAPETEHRRKSGKSRRGEASTPPNAKVPPVEFPGPTVQPAEPPQPMFPDLSAVPQLDHGLPQIDVTARPSAPSASAAAPFEFSDATLPSQSVARKLKRKSSRGWSIGGLLFAVLCVGGVLAGVAWYAMQQDTTLSGERVAFVLERGTPLPSCTVDRDLIEASDEVVDTVLKNFRRNPSRILTELVETEFGASAAGLEVHLREGAAAQFFRFPIDAELRDFYEKNRSQIDAPRIQEFQSGLKRFFEKWDVAVRNAEPVQDFSFRDSVGINACLQGLGYHMAAKVATPEGEVVYQCIYEDEENLYFLLPRKTRTFQVVGRLSDGTPSLFPGRYSVTVKASRTASAATESDGT